jgi:two-component system, NtrC family, response regulator AtoC
MSRETRLTIDTRPTIAQDRAIAAAPRAVLVVYGEQARTRVVELPDGANMTLGRSRGASLQIDSDRVSRIHARVTRRGNAIAIEDAGSRNGTWVNGEQIAGPRTLASGDEIVVGPITAVVSVTSRVRERPRLDSSSRLDERLAIEVDRGMRYKRPFSLLMARIEGEASEVDAAIDRLADKLRTMDLLAEYAPFEIAIVLPELDPNTVDPVARMLVTAARMRGAEPAPVTVVAGLVAFPAHGTTAGVLIARARAAMSHARADAIGAPPADPATPAGDFVVADPQMERVYELVRKVADHPITVLVCGETGVGKEVIASAIHQTSRRARGPLIRLNCASLPENLLESALFGHEKGAFTGADRRAHGYFEAAHGGTLFLDEIGEISPALQAKLLRVLEERRFTRVGGTEPVEVDVRVVCATNRDLEAEVRKGAFRSDLYFRIGAFTILVPPLRDRPGELLLLAQQFIRQGCAGRRVPVLAPAAVAAIQSYAWPGNVRELRNAIERALVIQSGGTIELEDLPDHLREHVDLPAQPGLDMRDHIAEVERQAILAALEACEGNQTEAARRLGLSRRTLIYRMEKHGLKPPPASRGRS